MSRPGSASGFTLIELMIVVTLIGIGAALVAPGLQSQLAETRAADAAESVVRLGRRARSQAVMSGLAHALVYSSADNGTLSLFRGNTDGCNTSLWDFTGTPWDELSMDQYSNPGSTHQITLTPDNDAGDEIRICYQPDGRMMIRQGGNGVGPRFVDTMYSDRVASVGLVVRRLVSGNDDGPAREIRFPFGGTPTRFSGDS